MSAFINKEDYRSNIKTYRLDQLLNDDDQAPNDILEDAEDQAVAEIKDALSAYYDVDAIFATVGAARPKNVLRWAKCLTLYYIFDRLPDDLVPERVVKNYDDCMKTLEAIADGKRSVILPPKLDEDEKPETKFRWGSRPARSHGDE